VIDPHLQLRAVEIQQMASMLSVRREKVQVEARDVEASNEWRTPEADQAAFDLPFFEQDLLVRDLGQGHIGWLLPRDTAIANPVEAALGLL